MSGKKPYIKLHDIKVTGIYEGELSTFRGRPELCDICH